ncbi:MAG: hypothetical protein IPH13_11415 [Planctomycetes bacterium]|nr:hypothetical protein [Planctomycetota bacterium]MCC7172945.1 hypothetical protein [Planctomycetota bacterium]
MSRLHARSSWILVVGFVLTACVHHEQPAGIGSIRFDLAGASTKLVVLGTAATSTRFDDPHRLIPRQPTALALMAPAEQRIYLVGTPRGIVTQMDALRTNANLPTSKQAGLVIDGVVPTDNTDSTVDGLVELAIRPASSALAVYASPRLEAKLREELARRGAKSACRFILLPPDRPFDLCPGLSIHAFPHEGPNEPEAFAIRGARRSVLYAPNLDMAIDPFIALREPIASNSIALLAAAPFESGAIPPAAPSSAAETTTVRALLTSFRPDDRCLDPSSSLRAQLAALGAVVLEDGAELWL